MTCLAEATVSRASVGVEHPLNAGEAPVVWQASARLGTPAIWGAEMTLAFRMSWSARKEDSGQSGDLPEAVFSGVAGRS